MATHTFKVLLDFNYFYTYLTPNLNESLFLILLSILVSCCSFAQNFEELLEELDQSVANYAIYSDTKEGEINQLKELLLLFFCFTTL
jgi:hypothetical protein